MKKSRPEHPRNIGSRRAGESCRKRSEKTYRRLFESAGEAIFVIVDGRIVFLNPATRALFGLSGDEVMGAPMAAFIHPEDRQMVTGRYLGRLKGDNPPRNYLFRVVRPDGAVRWVEVHAVLIDWEGKTGTLCFLTDTTERKAAEQALAEGTEKFRLLFENSPDPVVLVDGERYIDCNEAALRLLGCERKDQLVGLSPWDVAPERQADGRLSRDVGREFNEATLRLGRNRFEFLRRTLDGREICVDVSQTVVPIGGRQILYTVLRDITERKKAEVSLRESEGKFRDLVEKSLVGVYLIQDGVFKYVNARFAEIYGYGVEELTNIKGPKDMTHPEDLPQMEENIRRRLSGEIDSINFCFRIITKVGQVRHVEAYGSRTVYLGRPAVIGTLQDITDRKVREEELLWKTTFLKAMVSSSDDGILVVDTRKPKVVANHRMIDMWKIPRGISHYGSEEEKIGYVTAMIKDPGRFHDMIAKVYNRPEETVRGEFDLKDGTAVDVGSYPVLGKDGQQYGRIWKFRDITEMRRYWDMLETLSTTDGLTGLSNRRRFDEFLDREWRRGTRQRSCLSLILMDIDHFKEFNDHYGHLAGDDCLRRVAAVLSSVIRRAGDLAARYGGEEFACILPDTDPDGAVTMACRIMKGMDGLAIPHLRSPVGDHVTMSCGVATLVPEKERTSSDLVRLADRLLYSAKEEGRNRVKSGPEKAKTGLKASQISGRRDKMVNGQKRTAGTRE